MCPQQMLRERANKETFVSATMCPQQCVLVCQYLKGTGKRGHIVADTLLLMMFLGLRKLGNICCGHKFCVRDTKMFLILFRNILCPQQIFPSLRAQGNVISNNVFATMCPRLPVPLNSLKKQQRVPCKKPSQSIFAFPAIQIYILLLDTQPWLPCDI